LPTSLRATHRFKDWGVALTAPVPLIAPLATAIAGLAFAFKGLAAAISLAGAALIKLPLAGLVSAFGALAGGAAALAALWPAVLRQRAEQVVYSWSTARRSSARTRGLSAG
jgi:hypothetical protein